MIVKGFFRLNYVHREFVSDFFSPIFPSLLADQVIYQIEQLDVVIKFEKYKHLECISLHTQAILIR